MGLQAVRGTADILPDEVTRWAVVEHTAKRLARVYGYRELRTPLIEDAALFLRSVGETTDIVQKEMFRVSRLEDREGHDLVLRPEATASVVRAYLEHNLHKMEGFAKLFYLGPMFRAERPQAGRFRQFHQYGVEAIGSGSAWVDAEVITLCVRILHACGLSDTTVWLSSMGCRDDQNQSASFLRVKLKPYVAKLDKPCRDRFDKNVFRVLDCKNPECQRIVSNAVKNRQAGVATGSPFQICDQCERHFMDVQLALKDAGVPFDTTKVFARGLDYYTRTVFEVRAKGLGAQDAVAAGGRYDHLVEELGGPSVGAVGFAAGIERVLMAVDHRKAVPAAPPKRRGLYLAIAPPTPLSEGFRFVQQLRERGVAATMDYEGRSLKAQLREADKAGCQLVAILGESELNQRSMTVKDLGQGSQQTVAFDAFIDTIAGALEKTTCH